MLSTRQILQMFRHLIRMTPVALLATVGLVLRARSFPRLMAVTGVMAGMAIQVMVAMGMAVQVVPVQVVAVQAVAVQAVVVMVAAGMPGMAGMTALMMVMAGGLVLPVLALVVVQVMVTRATTTLVRHRFLTIARSLRPAMGTFFSAQSSLSPGAIVARCWPGQPKQI